MLRRYLDLAEQEQDALLRTVSIEAICLQLRLILEHVAFASLIANREAYAEARAEYADDWRAPAILAAVAKVNPNFYPVPVRSEITAEGATNLEPLKHGFLTPSQFKSAYERCGSALHVRNPYRVAVDQKSLIASVDKWATLVAKLLDQHLVQIVGHHGFIYVAMNPRGTSAAAYRLSPEDDGDFINTWAKP